ncbi:EG45-like domain containing protein [Cucurbita maxima]|uniref:EG45-like domain containing protein n=1 Tax=Cucurbita maxima TaxID=3661 RepID=A0A6J1K9Z5_CUCMA|nr:EG45-like domain containing protein [Cucurbita maxima]
MALQHNKPTTMALLFFLVFERIYAARADIGTAIAYGPPYLPTRCNGNNIDQFPPGNFFVAVNEGLWDNGAACGRRYRLRCLSGRNHPCKTDIIEVQVVNFCPKSPCPSSFLMSKEAFSAISRLSSAKLNVEYIEI